LRALHLDSAVAAGRADPLQARRRKDHASRAMCRNYLPALVKVAEQA
jgi:hypothetical protein